MRAGLSWVVLVWVTFLLGGCRKDLCYDHNHHTERVEYMLSLAYDIEWEYNLESHIDWEQYWNDDFGIPYDSIRSGHPEGVRIHIYDAEDRSEIVRNIGKEGATVHFTNEGYYSVLMHNNDTVYIVYEGMHSFASAYVTTRHVSRASYLGNPYTGGEGVGDEETVNPPDMLFGAYLDSVYVRKSTKTDMLSVTLHPLVFTYLVRYEIEEGAEYVALARGALAGMAKGVNLGNGHITPQQATVLYDATVTDFGAQALVKSFGVPDYPNPNYSRNPGRYGLNLEVRLQDGSVQQFNFDVTDQVEKQPHGEVVVVRGIKITPPVGGGGGGFNVGVTDWGDIIDIPLPL